MVDKVKIRKYVIRNKYNVEDILNKEINDIKYDLSENCKIINIKILKDYFDCNGTRIMEVMYLLNEVE